MKVPFFDMAAELAAVRTDVDAAIKRVLDSGVFIGGPEVERFEHELAQATGARHAIGVSSGTDALHATFMALGIGPGDEVVTTPFTFFATAGSAARLGAKIVFADIDDETLTLDPNAALAACTERTRAIVPVNLFGHPAVIPVSAPCPIIEDSAQSIGATPPRGLAATLSFFPTKNLGALGDAGAVLTNNTELATQITLVRTHGARTKYHHVAIGGNFRLDPIQAAVLRIKLLHLERWTASRRSLAANYRALFAAASLPPELRLPAHHDDHVYNQFVIRAPKRDSLRAQLATRSVETLVYYPEPLQVQPCFADLGYRKGSLPVAEHACADVVALPIYPTLSGDAQSIAVEAIAAFYAQ